MADLQIYNEEIIQDYKSINDIIEDYGYANPFEKPNLYNMTSKRYSEKLNLAEFLQWGRRNPSRFCEEIFNVQLLDYQRYLFDSSWTKQFVVWAMSRNGGKALSIKTPIMMRDGSFRSMGRIKIGDYVMGDDGVPAQVIATSPIFYEHDCYKVLFEDGESIISDANHIWSVTHPDGTIKDMVMEDMAKSDSTYRVPLCKPIEYKEIVLPIDPYVFGAWVARGLSNAGTIRVNVKDLDDFCSELTKRGYSYRINASSNDSNKMLILANRVGTPLTTSLRLMGLTDRKRVPAPYVRSSIHQRLEFLRGFMDVFGEVQDGVCRFASSDVDIVYAIVDVINSLGLKHQLIPHPPTKGRKDPHRHTVLFYADKHTMPCLVSHKAVGLPSSLTFEESTKAIVEIKKAKTVPTKCITVHNESHRYLCGRNCTVTHNSIVASLFTMDKMMLIPNFKAYILSGVGSQSIEMFLKMEAFALKNISSFTNLNDIFQNNVVKPQAGSNGWVHNPASHTCRTYGGSQVFTLNGAFDNNRSEVNVWTAIWKHMGNK